MGQYRLRSLVHEEEKKKPKILYGNENSVTKVKDVSST
jgi:hypothetical protein